MTVDDQPTVSEPTLSEPPVFNPLAGGPLTEVREGLENIRESGCPVHRVVRLRFNGRLLADVGF